MAPTGRAQSAHLQPLRKLFAKVGRGFYSRARPGTQWLQGPPGLRGCLLPAFPHHCSFCGYFPLLGVNQGPFLPCHLPPGDIWQVAPTSLSLSFSMYDVGIIRLRGFKQGRLQTGPTHMAKRQPLAPHTAGTAPLLSHSPEGPSADTLDLPLPC